MIGKGHKTAADTGPSIPANLNLFDHEIDEVCIDFHGSARIATKLKAAPRPPSECTEPLRALLRASLLESPSLHKANHVMHIST